MRIYILAAALLFSTPVFASCPTNLLLKDAVNVTAPQLYTDDGSGNCQVNTAIKDGSDATLGAKGDSSWVSGSGSVIALLKNLATTMSSILTSVQAPPGLGTSGGWTPSTIAAMTNTKTLIKGSVGQLGFVQCDNTANSSASFIQIFNAATTGAVTLGSTTPTQIVPIPGTLSNGFVMNLVGMEYSAGIVVAATATATGAGAPASNLNCTFGFN